MDESNTNIIEETARHYGRALGEEIIVAKPSKSCESKETKLKIKENVSMLDFGTGITDMRDDRDGAVVIKGKDVADANLG